MKEMLRRGQDEIENDSRYLHNRMARRIAVRFIGTLFCYEIGLTLFFLLIVILAEASGIYYDLGLSAVKSVLVALMYFAFILFSILGCCYITYRFMLRPLSYLDDVMEAARELTHPTEAPIILANELESIQDDMNAVREDAIRNKKAAEEAERRKDDLLVYLAHDLRTPLTSIIGYLRLIEDDPDLQTESFERYVGTAREKTEQLEDMINEFFEITRFNTHSLVLNKVSVNLSRMLNQIAFEFQPLLKENEQEWRLEIPDGVEIICDPDKLGRALSNLIQSISSYSFSKAEIGLKVKQRITTVKICIEGSGETIPPEILEHVFDRFYRTDSTKKGERDGAGIGLAIAKELIGAHQGTVRAYSDSGINGYEIELPADCGINSL